MLSFNDYQKNTANTAIYPGQGQLNGLLYVSLGLGEAGEIQGKIKKILRDDNGQITNEKRESIAKELGDLLWYISQTCTELCLDLDDVASANLKKLNDRQKRGVISGNGDER